jgi:hypothetical protein
MTPSPKNRECRICLEYISFDAESAGDARSTLCFWLLGSSQPKNWGEEGRNVPNVRTNPLCQIRLTHISFDAPSDGDARGALRFCCWAVLGRKTGVRRAVTYEAYVRALSSERIFRFFHFRPTTPHSTRHPTATPAVPSVSTADQFLGKFGRLYPSQRYNRRQ